MSTTTTTTTTTFPVADRIDSPSAPERVSRWTLDRLPIIAKSAFNGRLDAQLVIAELNLSVFAELPDADLLTRAGAQRLLVDLGFCGSVVARVARETGQDVARALGQVRVGARRQAFRDYYADLATRSQTGHPPHQAFVSTITWNAPTVEVWVDGTVATVVPSAFDDGRTRTWTGTADEARLWRLFKACAAIGAHVNEAVGPVAAGDIEPDSPDASSRLILATVAMDLMRDQMRLFSLDSRRGNGMSVDVFMNGIRQFGVPWADGLEAPSGPQEAEWIKRDVIVGFRDPKYLKDVRSRYPMMLASEVHAIEEAMASSSLEETVRGAWQSGRHNGPSEIRLASTSLAAHALWRSIGLCSAAHLGLARKFLFTPRRKQEAASKAAALRVAVPNDLGITGMTQNDVESLAEQRLRKVFDDIVQHVDAGALAAAESDLARRPRPACSLVHHAQ